MCVREKRYYEDSAVWLYLVHEQVSVYLATFIGLRRHFLGPALAHALNTAISIEQMHMFTASYCIEA